MNLTLWIFAGVLAVAFTVGGASQLLMARDRYRNLAKSQHWVDDFDATQLKLIGAIKLSGALALFLPAALGVAPVLTPIAACALALFMAGATTIRFQRHEWRYIAGDLLFVGLFVFVAWGRFDLQPL